MTTREIKLCRALLLVVHDLDGGQIEEILLHARVNEACECSVAEFAATLAHANVRGWVNRVENKTTKRIKWNISDAGEAALLEL